MTIEEVTEWDTTIKGNIAHHPTGPAGERAAQTSTSFRELQAAIARWRDILGGGGSGQWVKISETTPTAAQTFDITWDESLYVAIRFEIEGLDHNTDTGAFLCRLGHTNGTVIFDQASDYEGQQHGYSAVLVNMGTTSIVTLTAGNWGNATNEKMFGTLELTSFRDPNSGAIIDSRCVFKDTGGTLQCTKTEAHLEGTNVGAIDTIRFEVSGGQQFLATGTVRAYGLLL